MGGLGLLMRRRAIQAHPTTGSDYIKFADDEVLNVLMSKGVSSDGVGITKDDAARVTNIASWFTGNAIISSFKEFVEFKGVTFLTGRYPSTAAFINCKGLEEIDLPDSITSFDGDGHETSNGGTGIFWGCTNLKRCRMSSGLKILPGAMFYNAPLEELSNLDWSKITRIGRRCINKGTLSYDILNLASLVTYEIGALAGVTARKVIMPKVTSLPKCNYEYDLPKGMQILDLGESIAELPYHAIYGKTNLTLIVRAITPPTLNANAITQKPTAIYVPNEAIDAYKAAANWSTYANIIMPLSEYQG